MSWAQKNFNGPIEGFKPAMSKSIFCSPQMWRMNMAIRHILKMHCLTQVRIHENFKKQILSWANSYQYPAMPCLTQFMNISKGSSWAKSYQYLLRLEK